MVDKLFLTSNSGFDEEQLFLHSIQLFYILFYLFIHISTVKSELLLVYWINLCR